MPNFIKLSHLSLLSIVLILPSACNSGGSDNNSPTTLVNTAIVFDCINGPQCPEIIINGDPWALVPGSATPSPLRGYGDPSLSKDPDSSRMWLSYSYVGVHVDPSGDPLNPLVTTYVSTHLAHSDDNGASWTKNRSIWESVAETDQGASTDSGYSVHEVSTITPFTLLGTTNWHALHMRYFLTQGSPIEDRKGDSFRFHLTNAATPGGLGDGPEAVLGGLLTHAGWAPDMNLSRLDPELSECDVWTEPSLHQVNARLYLIAQCLVVDASVTPPVRVYDAEFLGVFSTAAVGPIAAYAWQWVGKLTTSNDAIALGGTVLTQADIARGKDGNLLLLVTPKIFQPENKHLGCRVLQLDSLDPPQLSRDTNGALIVRADIRSSDATGSGLCTYDFNSGTGIMFVREERDLSVPEVKWRLHATRIHP